MPRNYITRDGFHITEKARAYFAPLIQGEGLPSLQAWHPSLRKARKDFGEEKTEEMEIRLRCQSFDVPTSIRLESIPEPIVQPILASLPKFNLMGFNPIAAPEIGKGYFA